jgi:AGZA family xanthine/uracil permease-like MFS transporter
MSQQQTSQSSGQGLLERVFKLREHGTTARTEAIAGFTTFLTMVYIVFVNPQILGVAGMDTSAVFVTTCLIAAFGSILMGLFANLPVALAPAMGLNAFFAFVVVQAMGLPWQVGMGAIFWGAVGLLLLTIFRVRYWMIANIPVSLRVGITSGIGLFIGMMGLKNAGVIVANKDTLVSIGNLTSHSVLLGFWASLLSLFWLPVTFMLRCWSPSSSPRCWAGCWAMFTTPVSFPRRRALRR